MNRVVPENTVVSPMDSESVHARARTPNLDPITAEPGAHPLGTGIGAAAGGAVGVMAGIAASAASGAVAASLLGGPIGGAIGLVAGAVVGGMLGHAAGEAVHPTQEEHHWSSSYMKEPYYDSNYSYDDYLPAYRTGAEGFDADPTRSFDEIEAQLQDDYVLNRGRSRLGWEDARAPIRAAWERRRQEAMHSRAAA